ncbi:hypothetical protein TG4357_00880 [Thalassovita gelatinovora]|uniref:DUF4386 domain-containing protein n=1 Tax=Thalassovita gelatinovora TaxID=53501 RepID=A0A0N7LUK7_THAGE|nr:DUF4386 domain-containing protein [Thalassovita gelatinovora]QIZ82243.1 DUF4386 domain-containing protein [Thalassovita gelatinovora]CUH63770.1 hypothetical protein TG4357_00880 [Thalassovita gelatinovora]SEQ97942.1 protein of unknown function [Thalassovita gelatinovora]
MSVQFDNNFRSYARPAGLSYLIIILFGISAELLLRGPLIDWSSAETTARALREHASLFRLSLGADMIMALCDVVLAVLLYRILRPVNEALALLAMVLRLVQMAIVMGSMLYLVEAELAVATGGDVLDPLRLHAAGYDLGLLFFGANTLITAVLLCRSDRAPVWLAAALGAAGVVYLTGSLSRFVAPDFNASMQIAYLLPLIAETGFCLWLLFAARPPEAQVQQA